MGTDESAMPDLVSLNQIKPSLTGFQLSMPCLYSGFVKLVSTSHGNVSCDHFICHMWNRYCVMVEQHTAYIISESLQRTAALPLQDTYVRFPLPTETKASEGLSSQ